MFRVQHILHRDAQGIVFIGDTWLHVAPIVLPPTLLSSGRLLSTAIASGHPALGVRIDAGAYNMLSFVKGVTTPVINGALRLAGLGFSLLACG